MAHSSFGLSDWRIIVRMTIAVFPKSQLDANQFQLYSR
ncbi:hypothetical protein LEP1GSC203_3123 [Leptospira terpstrae serovar Hualin str. LT 11-33 = ATCC 700639]|uniref:Uncharacterized protein n=2 Tax=Leptospira TaxID=171 RepID=N1W669_9LEPT|nr:hypothetical protein LEP1GSC203_3123 [Leptospira terpstrae serovar Hualin str. LT 11-33 = ATCC 700639]EMY71374.1 hypothetical protein LEP1GSC199_3513 [Leptospira vanthielii serovar Holland str. Waz Holland = ATCC 700522]